MISEDRNDTIHSMEKIEHYLYKAVTLLKDWLPEQGKSILETFEKQKEEEISDYDLEEDGRYVYLIFSWKETEIIERTVLLVYEEDQVIADLSFLSMDTVFFLFNSSVYEYISEESDWMYLCHYVLCGMLYPSLAYPPCKNEKNPDYSCYENSLSIIYSNAYVTKKYRRQGIFSHMMEMSRDFALRNSYGSMQFNAVISLDPDIAVYGPDAVKEPYHYNYVIDEPVRELNAQILKKLGYVSTRLVEDSPLPNEDGTKLWFAVKRENDILIDKPYLS